MRRELEWLRQSPKARTSKSRSRIDQAHALKDELSSVRGRNLDKRADIKFAATERATRKLLTAHNLIMKYDGRTLFSGVDIVLSPGTRLGIVGINGTGKSTLLKILAGKSEPQQGTLKLADGVKIVYFDQHREQLPLDTPLRYALAENGETVYFQGRPIHVSGWAKRFLFSPDRLDQQIGTLSGGERARILIARLVLKPADILLLDEPTNDLDIETLEILEESLLTFPGAVVLITHDRLMLDGISTEIIGLGTGCDDQRFADYAQWEAFRKKKEKTTKATTTAGQAEKQAVVKEIEQKPTTESAKPKKQKLSYKEQRELAMMEERILEAEEVVEKQQKHVEDPSVIADGKKIQEAYQKLGAAQSHLDALYQRWQELEA
jgi:ATP-binding cassette subfamily F protein uup